MRKTPSKLKVLIIEDDPDIARVLKLDIENRGHGVVIATTQEEAYHIIEKKRFHFALLDLRLPIDNEDMEPDVEVGFDILKYIRERFNKNRLPILVMTAYEESSQTAVRAFKAGANDYIKKPFHESSEPLEDKIRAFELLIGSRRRGRRGKDKAAKSDVIIGRSPKLQDAIALARRAAKRDVSVVITGETGTGKELIAREVHRASARKGGRFVPFDCTGVPDTLIESELFGIEGNVATGVAARPRVIETAEGGTLFLDEIAELPPNQQAKFLRVLQERKVARIGSRKPPKPVDFRLVAATNKNLIDLIEKRKFREDLYYRINVVQISLPPLRERKEDVPVLARHFLCRYRGGSKSISRPAMLKLKGHNWPGNVRELENAIQGALVFCDGRTISANHIRWDDRPSKTETDRMKGLLLNNRQKLIYRCIREHGKTTCREARGLLNVSGKTANKDFAGLIEMGLVKKNGAGRSVFYALAD
jgi:DNA-binding NtrC family response regulator